MVKIYYYQFPGFKKSGAVITPDLKLAENNMFIDNNPIQDG
jgi:hypothetical protein